MDGTLWDAVDSYTRIWEATSAEFGVDRTVTREELIGYMGKTLDVILDGIMEGINIDRVHYLKRLDENESDMMATLGGQLYDGVADGIKTLSSRYRLFLVSNCGKDGLVNMTRFTGLDSYFEGTLTFGETHCGKAENIRTVIDKYGLKNPLYIGDTQGDSDAAHRAGIDMCHVTYGFGNCRDAQLSADSFDSLVTLLNNDGGVEFITSKDNGQINVDK